MFRITPAAKPTDFHLDPTHSADLTRLVEFHDIREVKGLITHTYAWLGHHFLDGALSPTHAQLETLLGPNYNQVTLEFLYPSNLDAPSDAVVQLIAGTNVVTVRSYASISKPGSSLKQMRIETADAVAQTPLNSTINGSLSVTLCESASPSVPTPPAQQAAEVEVAAEPAAVAAEPFPAAAAATVPAKKQGLAFCHHHLPEKQMAKVLDIVAGIILDPEAHMDSMSGVQDKVVQRVKKSGPMHAATAALAEAPAPKVCFRIKGRPGQCYPQPAVAEAVQHQNVADNNAADLRFIYQRRLPDEEIADTATANTNTLYPCVKPSGQYTEEENGVAVVVDTVVVVDYATPQPMPQATPNA